MNRRSFLGLVSFGLTASSLFSSCRNIINQWILRLILPNRNLGHRLLTMNFPTAKETVEEDVLIIGGGISGLSAAYYLTKNNFHKFKIIDLENEVGGNSRYGQNKLSTYPLGAHYLPLPNLDDKELISFLTDKKIIIGTDDNGIPEIDNQYLSFSQQERLFIHNKWQDDIIPKHGLSKKDKDEMNRFYDEMNQLQDEIDSHGNYYFDIPLYNSSRENKYKIFDKITMDQWLKNNGYFSEYLIEHIDYCCRDDYGLGITEVSAYAGLSYFASRKSKNWKKYEHSVITSSKGNGLLVDLLKEGLAEKCISKSIAYKIELKNGKVEVLIFKAAENKSQKFICNKIIVCTPQFITHRLMPERKKLSENFYYNPWIVATLTIDRDGSIAPDQLDWDNVIHGGQGLGYIYAQHQALFKHNDDLIITYYYTLRNIEMEKRRKFAYDQPKEYWENLIISDLEIAHFELRKNIKEIEINIWGHGMISPRPGFIFSDEITAARKSIENKIYFAHSDLAGISIFEEAFHQGINAAKKIMNQ